MEEDTLVALEFMKLMFNGTRGRIQDLSSTLVSLWKFGDMR